MEMNLGSGDLSPQRVAIVRALPGLGDLLCAVPAFRALRKALPEAHIALVGLPEARPFVTRFNRYLDALWEFPGFPGLKEQSPDVHRLPAFLTHVHQERLDLTLQMHGTGINSNPFAVLLGARTTAGYFLPGQYCPDPEHFMPYPDDQPEVRRHLQLMERLGIPLQGEALEFPLFDEDWSALERIPECRELEPGQYVCVHPGASTVERRWSPEQFAIVADQLAGHGLQVILTGSEAEVDLAEAVGRRMQKPSLNLAGRTSLGALAALISRARLLICNDTGVSHLAAALAVPSVVIFLTSDPTRWAPLDSERHRVVCPEIDELTPATMPGLEVNGHTNGSSHSARRLERRFAVGLSPEVVMVEAETVLRRRDVEATVV